MPPQIALRGVGADDYQCSLQTSWRRKKRCWVRLGLPRSRAKHFSALRGDGVADLRCALEKILRLESRNLLPRGQTLQPRYRCQDFLASARREAGAAAVRLNQGCLY